MGAFFEPFCLFVLPSLIGAAMVIAADYLRR